MRPLQVLPSVPRYCHRAAHPLLLCQMPCFTPLPPPTTLVIVRLRWWRWFLIGFLSDSSNRKLVIIVTQTKCSIYRTLGKLGLQTLSTFQEYQTQNQGSQMRLMKNRKKKGYDDDNDDDDDDDIYIMMQFCLCVTKNHHFLKRPVCLFVMFFSHFFKSRK